jgi:hypothetical protein
MLGATLVILPTLPSIRERLIDQNKIDELQHFRRELLRNNIVDSETKGFDLGKEVIREQWDQDLSQGCSGFRQPELTYINENNKIASRGNIIYAVWGESLDQDGPINEKSSQKIEPTSIIDYWLLDRVDTLKTKRIEFIRSLGFVLIIIPPLSEALPMIVM